ncbi:hypothetical protein [Nocardia sp. NPDC050412]|uniref:hypothetical protein n=1 Tax=Nocardia sp. NPDC050412 TaxID=3364320 RepID=UPI0037996905
MDVGESEGAPQSLDIVEPAAVALPADDREPEAAPLPVDVSEPETQRPPAEIEAPTAVPLLADAAESAAVGPSEDLREPEVVSAPSGVLGDTANAEVIGPSRDIQAPEGVSPPTGPLPLSDIAELVAVDVEEGPAIPLPVDIGEPETVPRQAADVGGPGGAPQSFDPAEPAAVARPTDVRDPDAGARLADGSELATVRAPLDNNVPEGVRSLVDVATSAPAALSADVREPDVLPLSVDISNSESVQPRVDNQPPRAVPLPADVAEPAAVPLPADAWEPGIPQLPVDVQEPPLAAPVQEPDSASRPVCVQRPESVPVPVYARESEVARPQAQELEPETVAFPVYFQESETVQLSAYPDVEMPCPSGESVDSVTLTTAVELAAQHGLDIIGFDGPNVDTYVVREVTAAVVDMLTRYPIALRGIRITDPDDSAPAIGGPSPALPQSDASAIWMVLDGGALATLVPEAGSARPRRWLRRRRNADRPVYAAVVREYGCALDVAGDFRARHEAQRRLITESLRGSAGLAYNPLDPSLALLDAFTDVALHGDRAGKLAKELHDMLVKMARAESTDLSA